MNPNWPNSAVLDVPLPRATLTRADKERAVTEMAHRFVRASTDAAVATADPDTDFDALKKATARVDHRLAALVRLAMAATVD